LATTGATAVDACVECLSNSHSPAGSSRDVQCRYGDLCYVWRYSVSVSIMMTVYVNILCFRVAREMCSADMGFLCCVVTWPECVCVCVCVCGVFE
jgi:hypothetical protein